MSLDDGKNEQDRKSERTGEIPAHIPWIRSDLIKQKKKAPYFQTSDLVIIALFSGLGGIFSTYIGYFANLLNSLFGIPFGGGQFLAGLHIFWLVFIYLLTDRKTGVILTAGILKGFIEFFTGNAHGILVILLSTTQGFIIELILIIFLTTKRNSILSLAAGFAGLSNVLLQQVLFFNSQIPISFIALIGIISFLSGLILGGFFPISVFYIFDQSTLLEWRKHKKIPSRYSRNFKAFATTIVIILIFVEVFVIGFLASQNTHSIKVTGEVYNPYTFYISDFPQITIEAELIGDVSYEPPRNYSGVPLYRLVDKAQPKLELFNILLKANDGYSVTFNSTEVDNNENIIVVKAETGLKIVAAHYHGSYWIKNIATVEIVQFT